jgi:PAS domain S-box-containing protein
MSTMAKNDPIPVDDQGLFSRQTMWRRLIARISRSAPHSFLAIIALAGLTFVCFRLQLNISTVGFLYLIVIVPLSLAGDYFASIVTSVIGAVCLAYFFAPPIFSIRVDDPLNIVAIIAFLTTSLVISRLVSEVRTRSEKLRLNEHYLSEGQRLAHMGSWVFEPTGVFEYWSDELFRIYGLDPGRDAPTLDEYLACVHQHDREFVALRIERAIAEASGYDATQRIVRPNGEVRYIRYVGVPVLENGKLKKIVGSAIDVTEHELLTQEVQRREAYLAEAQRLSHTGSFGWNVSSDEHFWSNETFRVFEFPHSSLITLPMILERVYPQDRPSVKMAFGAAAHGEGIDFDCRLLLPDGKTKYLHVVGKAQKDSTGSIEVIGAVMDVTVQKLTEAELRRSKEYLTNAQKLSRTGSVGMEIGTKRIFWSEESTRIYGYPLGTEPTPELILQRVHPDDVDLLKGVIERAAQGGGNFDFEYRLLMPDGSIKHIHNLTHFLRNETGNGEVAGAIMDITEHKVAKEAIRRSEAYLAEAQKLSHTGSFGWNTVNGEIVWSDETYRIFEYDCASRPTLDLVVQRTHPQDRALAQQVIDRASQTGTDFEHEYRLLLADGRVKHVHAIAYALQDSSGNREFIGAVTDITERKTAEEKIQRNERELRTLIEAIPAYVGTNLPDGSVDFISQSWLDYTGFSREQGMGWGWESAVHPEDLDRVVANWRAAVAAGVPVEHELRCRCADGTYHWFLYRGLPLRDDGGNVVKWYGTLTNIDALKETESTLQMREHELLGILETIPSMLWSTSPTGESTHNSQRLLEYVGASHKEFVNRGWLSFVHPDDREESAKVFFRAIETGKSYNVMHRVRRADGEYRWFQTKGEPLCDFHGEIIQWYGLSIDIDERKRAEDHLRDTRITLAKASRLATVAELAGSIAHELNQPLMSILGNAQAAKKWLNAAASNVVEVNSSIERIIRDARAADETMQHIRALFKQESFDKKDVNIPDILREVVRVIQEDPNKRNVPIECRFEDSLPLILVDQIQIQQVFINLIVNAIEALEEQVAPQVVLRAVTDSNGMLIQVIDNGPGVDDPDRIFDAFMTTKEKGMGIGLAVSRSIVDAHGGQIWAENNKTGGAIFNVALPLSHASTATAYIQETRSARVVKHNVTSSPEFVNSINMYLN